MERGAKQSTMSRNVRARQLLGGLPWTWRVLADFQLTLLERTPFSHHGSGQDVSSAYRNKTWLRPELGARILENPWRRARLAFDAGESGIVHWLTDLRHGCRVETRSPCPVAS